MIYVDLDGVLADFDALALQILGEPPGNFEAREGAEAFWRRLGATPDLYRRLPKMPDADVLWAGVCAYGPPIILTGIPSSIPRAGDDKRAWVADHFPGATVITCFARHKARYCRPGDTLIDDRTQYRHLWEAAGGRFIVHVSAAASLAALEEAT